MIEFIGWLAVLAFCGALVALCASYLLGGDQ